MAKNRPFRSRATYIPISMRSCSRSLLKRAHSRRNLRVRALDQNGQSPAISVQGHLHSDFYALLFTLSIIQVPVRGVVRLLK